MLDFGNASSLFMRRQREVPRATLESPLARGLWGEGSQAPHQSRLPPKALAQPGGCRVVFQPLFPHRADGSTGADEPRGRAIPPVSQASHTPSQMRDAGLAASAERDIFMFSTPAPASGQTGMASQQRH